MVCLLLKGLVDHNGKMDALLKRTSSVKVDLFQVICFSIRSNYNERLGSACEVKSQSILAPTLLALRSMHSNGAFILSGSPNECWLRTCWACVIATW